MSVIEEQPERESPKVRNFHIAVPRDNGILVLEAFMRADGLIVFKVIVNVGGPAGKPGDLQVKPADAIRKIKKHVADFCGVSINEVVVEDQTGFQPGMKGLTRNTRRRGGGGGGFRPMKKAPNFDLPTSPAPAPPDGDGFAGGSVTDGPEMREVLSETLRQDVPMTFPEGSVTIVDKANVTQDPNEKYMRYEVLYGTNRNANGGADLNNYYGVNRGNQLITGRCEVSLPHNRDRGSLPRPPWWTLGVIRENPNKHVMLLEIEQLELHAFRSLLGRKFSSTTRVGLLFIHGYNNSFAEAARRSAQLGYDLAFPGPVFCYSWPSLGKPGPKQYITDGSNAEASPKYFAEFLKVVLQELGSGTLHIIAHSMGNLLLTEALLLLHREGIYPARQINEIVLAAPDLDKQRFLDVILPAIRGPRLTMYASSEDKALLASRYLRSGYSRLGLGGKELAVADGIESIDASRVNTDLLGHGYFAETISLINDLHAVLRGASPRERVLDEQRLTLNGRQLPFWIFRQSRS